MLASLVLAPCAYGISSREVLRDRDQEHQLHVDTGTMKFFRHHGWLLDPRHRETRDWALGAIEAARHRIPVLRARLARARSRLRPPPGHRAGWVCIHSGEAAWNADTGNGFYGGLQMSYGWAGRVRNAAVLTPAEQMAVAEAEAAEHGWGDGWMRSQWPNTYPRCAGLFR
ncbi:MAG: Transglycosylase-like domain [Gaiellaceae bacterium]|jgi:hypothetical protein|nr:Transglycosylase-like domain [Gaiellaceae bacterium]